MITTTLFDDIILPVLKQPALFVEFLETSYRGDESDERVDSALSRIAKCIVSLGGGYQKHQSSLAKLIASNPYNLKLKCIMVRTTHVSFIFLQNIDFPSFQFLLNVYF